MRNFGLKHARNGVIQMSLDALLGYLKADQAQKVVPMGDRIQGKDFPAQERRAPPVSTGNVSEIFKPRRPVTP